MKNIKGLQHFKSREEWEEYVWSRLVENFTQAKSREKAEALLGNLFTPHELQMMIKRAVALSMLKQGKSYREIGEMLWISSHTISALSKSLKSKTGYISRYAHVKKREKSRQPLTKNKSQKLQIRLWFEALLTFPPPPFSLRDYHSRFRNTYKKSNRHYK